MSPKSSDTRLCLELERILSLILLSLTPGPQRRVLGRVERAGLQFGCLDARGSPKAKPAMSQSEALKQLKIKTNTAKRLHKEMSMYEKERDKEQARLDQMKAGGADGSDLRQAVSSAC
jgi:hypothetical protein